MFSVEEESYGKLKTQTVKLFHFGLVEIGKWNKMRANWCERTNGIFLWVN